MTVKFMSINLTKYFYIFAASISISIFFCTKKRKAIVFNCFHCKGCVQIALNDIYDNKYYFNYNVILDSNCFSFFPILRQINFKQLSQSKIDKQFGEFANIRIYDKYGNFKDLRTNESLKDYIRQ